MTHPVLTRGIALGSKLGIHAIAPGETMPLVRAAADRGLVWPLVKNVDNAGLAIDVKQVCPETLTITRFVNEQWDSAQDCDTWPDEVFLRGARETIQMVFDRTNADERAAADWFEVLNEADPPGVAGWRALGRFCCEVVREADRRGLKVALPAFNAGTPEWDEMQAFVETGLFGLLKAGGHLLTVHEGVFGKVPIDSGFGGALPGAPTVPTAGAMCGRYRYLYHLLAARDEVVPCVVSEFYSGDFYSIPAAEQVERFAWYDRLVRQDWYVLAVLPFTIGPIDGWRHQDYTYCYPAVLDYLAGEHEKPNAVRGAAPEPGPVVAPPVTPGPPPVVVPPLPVQPAATGATHRVTATQLSVRAHPWTGRLEPPRLRFLNEGDLIRIFGFYQPPELEFGWGCLSADGNEWVSMEFVSPL
jgi:hypothetical protein